MGCADDLYWEGFLDDWTQSSVHTYILLREGHDYRELEKNDSFIRKSISFTIEKKSILWFKDLPPTHNPYSSAFTPLC